MLIQSTNNSAALPVDPGINPLIPDATVRTMADTNDSVSPLNAAQAAASQVQAAPTILTLTQNPLIKNVMLVALVYLGWKYLRRK